MRIAAAVVALAIGGCTVGPDYVKPPVAAPAGVAHRLPAGGRRRQHALVGAVRRSGADGPHRFGAHGKPRPRDRRRARRRVHRHARDDARAVLPAGQLQPRREPQSHDGRRRLAAAARRGPLLQPLQRRAGRRLADRPLRPRAPADRGGAGAGLRDRAGPARRRAVGGDERRDELHRLARARQAARDRAPDRGELPGHAAHLRAAAQGRRRVEARGRAGRTRSTSRRSRRSRSSSSRSPRRRT